MQSKHTPGPWTFDATLKGTTIHVDGFDPEEATVVARTNEGDLWDFVCCMCKTDRDKANARLIAAAPDLLVACKALIEHIDHQANLGYSWAAQWREHGVGPGLAEQAISKAEGSE